MSKLIQDKENSGAPEHAVPPFSPLSGAVVVSHLKACQAAATNHSKRAFKHFLCNFGKAIELEISRAKSDTFAREWSDAASLTHNNKDKLERYFCGYLAEGFVKFKRRQLKTAIGGADSSGELSLLGNEELDESISISSMTQRADTYFAEPLWALNQRYAVLNGGEHVTERSNPAAPIQFCDSLRKALNVLPLKIQVKLLAYKEFDGVFIDLLRVVLEENNEYLKKQGILPHLKYSIPSHSAPESALQSADGSAASRETVNHSEIQGLSDQNLSPDEYQRNLLQAIRSLQLQLQKEEGETETASVGNVVVSSSELLQALNILQQKPVELPSLAAAGQSVFPTDVSQLLANLNQQIQQENANGYIDESNMHIIDLVGMLFEYMLGDENLPDSVKALLSYLHTPFLKIAFVDPGFFEQAEHPARLLINSLAEAGARWVGNDGTSQYDIYEKIKCVVDKILKEFDNDVKIFTSLLLEFNRYTKNIFRRQQLLEKRATEKAQGEEKLREVKLKVNQEIRSRINDRELPSAALLFLLQPWSDYLSFALLRYGESSEKWIKALAVVDDVMWGLEPQESENDKLRQQENYQDVLAEINSGFETIGYEQGKGAKLIDALSALLKLSMQSKRAEAAPPSMREQLERIAAEKAGDAEQKVKTYTPEESQMVESLKMIEFGTWFEFEGGRRLKVAWYNARTSHYMLVDQVGKRVDMMSGLKMAREMIAGTAKVISGNSKPFFERALENIFHKLNQRADSLGPGKAI